MQEKLDQAGISWDMHLFVDDSSSNAASIGNLIEQVYTKVNAEIVVLAQHNKVCKVSAQHVRQHRTVPGLCKLDNEGHVPLQASSSGFFGSGSVAQYCTSLTMPLALIP